MIKKPKILIIDADIEFANDFKDCLVNGGYHVLPIKDNVKDGIDAINEYHPDGVALDIQLKDGIGLDILNYLKSELGSGLDPVLIVVSSYLDNRIIALLNKKKCLYFDKSYNYKHELVLNYFNDMMMVDIGQKRLPVVEHKIDMAKQVQRTDEQTKYLIHKKLTVLGFNSTVTAYQYLIDTIHYILSPDKPQVACLTRIFEEVTYVQYNSAFNGIKRLITAAFGQNPESFDNFYHATSNAEIRLSPPSVKEFIYCIVDEIKEECFD